MSHYRSEDEEPQIVNSTFFFPNSDNEDLEAYVKEVTIELASEIKSEIRGVISKVEDVLDSNADNTDLSIYNLSSLTNLSRWANDHKNCCHE